MNWLKKSALLNVICSRLGLVKVIDKLSVKRLHDELDHWIFIGIGDDIVKCRDQRPEYYHLIKHFPLNLKPEIIAQFVLIMLKTELDFPWFIRPTFWHLVWLHVRSCVQCVFRGQ